MQFMQRHWSVLPQIRPGSPFESQTKESLLSNGRKHNCGVDPGNSVQLENNNTRNAIGIPLNLATISKKAWSEIKCPKPL